MFSGTYILDDGRAENQMDFWSVVSQKDLCKDVAFWLRLGRWNQIWEECSIEKNQKVRTSKRKLAHDIWKTHMKIPALGPWTAKHCGERGEKRTKLNQKSDGDPKARVEFGGQMETTKAEARTKGVQRCFQHAADLMWRETGGHVRNLRWGQVFKSYNRCLDSDLEWDALGYLECSALNLIGDIGTSELLQRLPLLNLTADY